MGQRDDMYNFQRHGVEFDEAYVWVSTESQTTVKTGKGKPHKKSNVSVMAESIPLEESESGEKSKSVRYFKMKVLENHKAKGIDEVVEESQPRWRKYCLQRQESYVNISDYVEAHLSEISNGANHQSDIKVGAHCHSQP